MIIVYKHKYPALPLQISLFVKDDYFMRLIGELFFDDFGEKKMKNWKSKGNFFHSFFILFTQKFIIFPFNSFFSPIQGKPLLKKNSRMHK